MRSAVQTALLLGLLYVTPSLGADNFGRLFSTPSERASLDSLRQSTKVPVLMEPSETTLEPVSVAPVVPVPISVQGYVKRSDGQKSTVWVNHQPMQENSSNSAVQVGRLGRDNEVQLKESVTGKELRLKAGQVYRPTTDTINEVGVHRDTANVINGSIGPNSRKAPDTEPAQPMSDAAR